MTFWLILLHNNLAKDKHFLQYIGIRMSRYKFPNKATFEHLSHDFNCKNVQFIFSTDYR